jgi:1,4-dihydroxy-6-naphthoate synthase
MTLSLGFSTCPNDTFIFDALVNHRTGNKSIQFEVVLADVEDLNKRALGNELDISKISYAAYPAFAGSYEILPAGSAIGRGNGPVIISKRKIYPDELNEALIAIPGIHTTANLLLSILFPGILRRREYLFSDIEEALLCNEVDAGVIIHENRFTYAAKGLLKVADLGEVWEKQTESPLPLGGIVIKRSLPQAVKKDIAERIAESIRFAFKFPSASEGYIKQYAQNLDESVIAKHINLFVNDFSIDMGEEGRKAIQTLFTKGAEVNALHPVPEEIFLA